MDIERNKMTTAGHVYVRRSTISECYKLFECEELGCEAVMVLDESDGRVRFGGSHTCRNRTHAKASQSIISHSMQKETTTSLKSKRSDSER
jgi:hypothetical protein